MSRSKGNVKATPTQSLMTRVSGPQQTRRVLSVERDRTLSGIPRRISYHSYPSRPPPSLPLRPLLPIVTRSARRPWPVYVRCNSRTRPSACGTRAVATRTPRRGPCGEEVADGAKGLHGVAGTEGELVREFVGLRFVSAEADRVGREPDASDFGEVWSEGEREKLGAALGVYEVGWRWRQGVRQIRGRGCGREDGVANVRGKGDEHCYSERQSPPGNRRAGRRRTPGRSICDR